MDIDNGLNHRSKNPRIGPVCAVLVPAFFDALFTLVIGWGIPAFAAGPDSHYVVTNQISLGAATKWDYAAVDSANEHLFLSRGTYVQVLNSRTGRGVAEIKDTMGVHGFAFAPDLNLGFISNGRTNTVTVFDLKTLKALKQIPVGGENPDAIVYDARSNQVFTFNGKSHDISVIDGRALTVKATIPAAGKPEFAVSDGVGHIYVNIENQEGEIQVLDTVSNSIVDMWHLTNCVKPTGLSIDRQHWRLFSACRNGVMAITDARTGKQVAQVKIGEGPDATIFDEKTQSALSSNGRSGTLTIVHEDDPMHFRVVADLATAKGARTMALDALSQRIYLPTIVGDVFTLIVVHSQ